VEHQTAVFLRQQVYYSFAASLISGGGEDAFGLVEHQVYWFSGLQVNGSSVYRYAVCIRVNRVAEVLHNLPVNLDRTPADGIRQQATRPYTGRGKRFK